MCVDIFVFVRKRRLFVCIFCPQTHIFDQFFLHVCVASLQRVPGFLVRCAAITSSHKSYFWFYLWFERVRLLFSCVFVAFLLFVVFLYHLLFIIKCLPFSFLVYASSLFSYLLVFQIKFPLES